MSDASSSHVERLAEWTAARACSDTLFGLVPRDRLAERPIAERHRLLFYLGHLEAFDWNLLSSQLPGARAACELDSLFSLGIDPEQADAPQDQPQDWPAIAQIAAYNQAIRHDLERLLVDAARAGGTNAATQLLLDVAVEHRLMHAETIGYMLAQSGGERRLREALPTRPRARAEMLPIPAGTATLGVVRDRPAHFAWDNEYEAHEVHVPEFEIARCMVSNGEWLEFMQAGGYHDSACWTPADWAWRCRASIVHPASWMSIDGRWHVRSLTEAIPLPPEWPVYVSHAEASAYATWSGAQLPTEAQWHRAAFGTPAGVERAWPWGDAAPAARHGNFGFRSHAPHAVDADPDGDSAFGVRGLIGNGWEWTCSVFAPFAGFRPDAFYPGYSAAFFDGSHYVLKGGSPLTAPRLLRRSFRNWFRPNYPFVFAGLRCVRN